MVDIEGAFRSPGKESGQVTRRPWRPSPPFCYGQGMETAQQATAVFEGGLAAVKEATRHLADNGIESAYSVADGCKPGS